jgi:hypothetical protein
MCRFASQASCLATNQNKVGDPDWLLNRSWDAKHDRDVLRCLRDRVEQKLEPYSCPDLRPSASIAATVVRPLSRVRTEEPCRFL